MLRYGTKSQKGKLWMLQLSFIVLSVTTRNTRAVTKHRSVRLDGDIILGALFPLHHKPPSATAYSRQCGSIWEHYGIQRVETFLLTLDKINSDTSILPGIKLGCDIRDSCWYSAIGLEQSIDFIKDAIASKTKANQVATGNGSSCDNQHQQPVAGLIGPGNSEATIQVQNLLQIFNIPQIGYSATSMSLSNKLEFKYFVRVVPPDNYQAQALVDIVLHYNWTYISTVHTDGNYGMRGIEEFHDIARRNGVCIATSDNVARFADPGAFDKVVDNLLTFPNATVVVCFCQGLAVRELFLAMERRQVTEKFLVIGSDGWGNRLDVVEGIEHLAAGSISIRLYSPPLPDFDQHYFSLRYDNPRNPWFREFWQERFGCYLDGIDMDRRFNTSCTGNETLEGTEQDSKLGFVVSAVYTLAYGLDRMYRRVCGNDTSGMCSAMTPINGSVLLEHIYNVSFTTYSNESVYFDAEGNPPGRYDILNYQPSSEVDNTTYGYVSIGSWSSGTLSMRDDDVYWPVTSHKGIIQSVCSLPCPKGHVKQVKGVVCCWVCTPCLENEIVRDNITCEPCQKGYQPNQDLSDCEVIPVDFISWGHTEAIVSMVLACVGILVTVWVFSVFVRHNDTPVVKASTRELSYIILLGTVLAYCSNFVMVAKPSSVFCYLSRILPGLAFSLIYGALVTKTNRIARILEGSKRIMTKKPRFMSASAQVVITGIVIGVECAVITVMLFIEPADSKLEYPTSRRVRLVCNTSTLGVIVPLGFDVFLIFMCTLYAIKTRNLPENFNEAKFIGFTMYTTCVIWLGFFPIYFGGESKEVTMCVSITLSASVSLVLLFFPKVYVILWSPERNTRGAFTTSRDVRCHIGSKSLPSCDSVDQREKKYEGLFRTDMGRPPGSRDTWSLRRESPGPMKRSSFPQTSPQHLWMNQQRPSHVADTRGYPTVVEHALEDTDSLSPPAAKGKADLYPRVWSITKDAQCQTTASDCCLRHRRLANPSQNQVLVHSSWSNFHSHPGSGPHERSPLLDASGDELDTGTLNTNPGLKTPRRNNVGCCDSLNNLSDLQEVHQIQQEDIRFKSLCKPLNLPIKVVCRESSPPLGCSSPPPATTRSLTSLSSPRRTHIPHTLSAFSSQDSVSGVGTFNSLISLTSSLASARTPEEVSVFSLSPLDTEEKRMLDFQHYLQSKGLQLDMSSVQSSDL